MELLKQPETEGEYWGTIEALGAFIHSMSHALSHGYIKEEGNENVSRDIEEARKISERLVDELEVKFAIVAPKNCPKPDAEGHYPDPPEGKRWYRPWYMEMKEKWLRSEYEKIICSACPLSEGFSDSFSYMIPCSVFPGMMYRLTAPHLCGMLEIEIWDRQKLLNEISMAGGWESVGHFLAKEQELFSKSRSFLKKRGV